jgi:hypothetical protein
LLLIVNEPVNRELVANEALLISAMKTALLYLEQIKSWEKSGSSTFLHLVLKYATPR